VVATEDEALAGGQDWDLNPVVYYRFKKPVTNPDALPAIDINALFSRQEAEDSQIAFTVSKTNIDMREIEQIELSDEQTKQNLERVQNFTQDEDD